ncbi:PIN domain-containing protein [Maricaulaceae bacterium EIL42A08]|nr:PIN domain-containing protein [Maricaulaceae bacterium EIL42A08]
MSVPAVFVDACVLVSAIRRHILFSLADAGMVHLRWSAKVLMETGHAHARIVGDAGRDGPGEAARLVTALEAAWPEASVPDDQSSKIRIEGPLPDRDDAHVMQAAAACGARFILTENMKDFPRKTLKPLGLYARPTGDYFGSLWRAERDQMRSVMGGTADRLNLTPARFETALKRAQLGGLARAYLHKPCHTGQPRT